MADCNGIVNQTFNAVGCAVQGAVESGVSEFAKAMMEGYDALLKQFITSWLGQGVLVDLAGPSVTWFQTSLSVINVFLIGVGLTIAGMRTALAARGEPATTALQALGRVLFVSFAGTLIVQVLLLGGNAFSKWILDSAGVSASGFAVAVQLYASSPGLAVILGLFGIMATGFQWGIMFVRGATLPLIAAFWPTAASMAMFKGHEGAFQKVTTWILAFILYTPLAACIYAFAWRLKAGDEGIGGVINGLVLICLAVLALPAMMRLMAPASEALGRAAGGAMAMGVTAAAITAGVAVGAAVATGGGSAAASGGGGAASSAGNAGAGVAKGGGTAEAAGGGGGGGSTPGPGGSGDSSKGGGSEAGGSAVGDSPSGGGGQSSGGGSTAPGGEATGGSGGGSTASGSGDTGGGSGGGWEAAKGVSDSAGNNSNEGTAEGMISG